MQQSHVHLISTYRFPLAAALGLEQAFSYLHDAPQIVKAMAPMSWHYVTAPRDGTMWLEWVSDKSDQPYPSDGYIWPDIERTYTQDYNGYTIELRVQPAGYRPNHDQHAQHARTRYRFVGKNPSVNAPHPDPSLWIVHYHRNNPAQTIPANQVPISPLMQRTMQQRRWLEGQGALERREFMLHDRGNWPVLSLPGAAQMQQPGAYGVNAMATAQARFPQPQLQQPPNAHPHKRARTQAPHPMPGAGDGLPDTTVEDEENTALGDFFDHLSQRDISLARYTQHHQWMEEVFSSPYATNQIVPADLGLGLMGELRGLTEGILEPPNVQLLERTETKPPAATEAQPFTNVKKEQVDEFSKRVEKHLAEGNAEIERMKAEHAAKMQDWKKVKALMQAEKRLRYATWQGHDEHVPAFRLGYVSASGHGDEDFEKGSVDDIVREVEKMLKVKIKAHEDCAQIARGGLRERKQPSFDPDRQPSHRGTDVGESNGVGNVEQQQSVAQQSVINGKGYMTTTTTTGQNINNPSGILVSNANAGQNQQATTMGQSTHDAANDASNMGTEIDNLPDLDMNDTLMDDMDIDDVDTSNINFDDLPNDDMSDEATSVAPPRPVGDPSSGMDNATGQQTADGTSDGSAFATMGATPGQQIGTGAKTAGGADVVSGETGLGEDVLADATGESSMFNDTFDGLENLGGGDDGLIDFDGGGMGMEDSAFGDALHGMETPDGGEGESGTATVGEP